MGVVVSSLHVVSAAPSSSGEGLLTLFPCFSAGCLPQGAVPQEQAAPAWVPRGSQAPPANLLQRGLLSPQVHRSCQEPAPARALHRVTDSIGHLPAPAWSLPQAAGGDLLHRGPPWAAGDSTTTIDGGLGLGAGGTGSIRHRGSFWQLLIEATPVAPSLPKPGHTNPAQTCDERRKWTPHCSKMEVKADIRGNDRSSRRISC